MSFSARSHLSMRVKPSAGPYFCGIDDREKGGERGQLQLLLLLLHLTFRESREFQMLLVSDRVLKMMRQADYPPSRGLTVCYG